MDEMRSLNGLTPTLGAKDGLRPPTNVENNPDDGSGPGAEYHPNDWREGDEPATTRIRRKGGGGGISSDDIPSPLQQELDRMRSIGEASTVDTKSLRGKRYYSGESSATYRRQEGAPEAPEVVPPARSETDEDFPIPDA